MNAHEILVVDHALQNELTQPFDDVAGDASSARPQQAQETQRRRCFDGHHFSGNDIQRGHFVACQFYGCHFEYSTLSQSVFEGCLFQGCHFKEPFFVGATLKNTRFRHCEIHSGSFEDANLMNVEFE